MLEKGCLLRVGNGETIKIYEDKWIPRPYLFKIWSPRKLSQNATVNELILPSGCWNNNLINNVFVKVEADLILSIPIGDCRHHDQIR